MTPFLQLAIALTIIITAAKLGGYLSYRIGQPAVLGELFVGIIIGPSVLNLFELPYFTDVHIEETIKHLAEIGVLLLMFLAGLDLHLKDLLRSGKVAGLSGVLGMLLPFGFGTLAGLLFSMDTSQAIFTGLILSATSVSISAQTLMELKVLRSRVGVGLLGAAVFDDILVLLGLSIFTAFALPSSDAGIAGILLIVLRVVLFLGIASLVGMYTFPKLSQWIGSLPISQGLIAFTFVTMLFYGWTAESLGNMAAITGAFLAGIWFGRTPAKDHIHNGISTIAYSIFVPVFFVNIGLSANVRGLTWESGLLFLVMLLVAVIGKVLGAGYGAFLGGLSRQEALQLGVGMMSRGEVGLIVAAVGIELGLIDQNIFSVVEGLVIVTILITPPLLRLVFNQKKADGTNIQPGGSKS
ncbi:MAG: cation:proton antiporter [Anaerolineales bacterium]|nr:MAG: cation:proton antiporter [Anaerolineales bacterium]